MATFFAGVLCERPWRTLCSMPKTSASEKLMKRWGQLIVLVCFAANASPLAAYAQRPATSTDCGWIGVKVSPMTKPFADSLGLTELYGAIFDQPEFNGPAAQAEIEAGDVITAINGTPLESWSDFTPTISAMAPGTEAYLTTYRDGQLMERRVTLGSSECHP